MQKNVFLLVVLLFTAFFTVNAQTSRGSVMAGGNIRLNFPTNDGDGVRQSNFSMQPSLGFFVVDNVVIGAGIPVTFNKYENDGSRYSKRNSSFGIAPFGRFYFGPANIKPFLEGRFGLEHFKTIESGKADRSDDAIFVGFGAGIAFFVNDHVAIEPKLSYDAYNRNAYTNSGVNLNIGFQVYLH